jgi:hypothetical protein
MPRTPNPPPPIPADWPHEKTYSALKKQLAALDLFRGKRFLDAENDEREWKNLTLNILTHGFGQGSNNVDQFHQAKNVGVLLFGNPNDSERQEGFERRANAFSAMLRSSIAELEYMLPQPEIAGAYHPGDEYSFYKDLKIITGLASTSLFVIDNYLDTQLFDVYMANVSSLIQVRVLTRQVESSLKIVAEKVAKRGGFELRSSNGVHDRVVFADDRCWVIGQSIKDAATKKPTYIVEHAGADTMRGIYETLWAAATSVVK